LKLASIKGAINWSTFHHYLLHNMGITIHYAGRAASEESVTAAFEQSIAIAREFGWKGRVPSDDALREEGVVFLPHEDCEPLHVRFSRTRRFSEYCKTQFAGPEVHAQVREFLERLMPQFSKFLVYDEAEDFDGAGEAKTIEDRFKLEQDFIEAGLLEYPGAQMKVRLPNGRIADLVT
jgi:hypothetical protein